jgi:hypothetical protein
MAADSWAARLAVRLSPGIPDDVSLVRDRESVTSGVVSPVWGTVV